jgi:hypothetical protein
MIMVKNDEVQHSCAIEEITPEAAKQMLHGGQKRNRNLSEPAVRRIMAIIERGEWMEDSTDAIGLATDGSVVNGQHRLEAISRGGATVRALVLRNVRKDVVKIIDQGMPRSLVQQLGIDGGYVEPGTTATAVDWMYNMIGRYERTRPTEYKPTIPQLLDLLADHQNLVSSIDAAATAVSGVAGRLPKGVLTAYHYAMACVDPEAADEFFTGLGTGLDVVEYSPVYVLRERFNKDLMRPEAKQLKKWEASAFLVIAWEATRRGEALKSSQLRITRSGSRAEAVPTVSGVDWLSQPVEAGEAA